MTSDHEAPAYRFARAVLRPPLMLMTRRDWQGIEHIPSSGGCVVVTNHLSHVDPFTFAHFVNDAGRAPRFLAKSEVFELPGAGAVIRAAGQIPVYRETKDAANAYRAALAAVDAGECVVIYPEGTLTRDPALWPMTGKTGAARIGLTTGCPVVPVAQWGPQHVLSPYSRVPKLFPRSVMHVWAGPPVDLDDLRQVDLTADVLRNATTRIMAGIVSLMERIRGESAPAQLYDPRTAHVPLTGNPARPRPDQDKRP
ncbi:MAG: lysophospholipid acyltransferase family protein [Actinomycetes bacterium]